MNEEMNARAAAIVCQAHAAHAGRAIAPETIQDLAWTLAADPAARQEFETLVRVLQTSLANAAR